jgi:hypothetical protein
MGSIEQATKEYKTCDEFSKSFIIFFKFERLVLFARLN